MKENRKRLSLLREKMKQKDLDAYLVVSDDFHASEYVGDYFKCREALSGFDGSSGTLLIMQDKAALWTDGRYFLQAEEQLRDSGIDLMKMGEEGVEELPDYLDRTLSEKGTLGFDGRTVSCGLMKKLEKKLGPERKFSWDLDLAGEVWEDRPKRSREPVYELEICYAGKTRAEKIDEIRHKMKEKKVNLTVISSLDDIAWLLNLRGNDVRYNPVFLSYLILTEEDVFLFLDPSACPKELEERLEKDGVHLKKYDDFFHELPEIARGKQVWFDPDRCSARIALCLDAAAKKTEGENLTLLPKALRNETEQRNVALAHKKDGAAVTRFLIWLRHAVREERLTELSVTEKLEEFRKMQDHYMGQSFAPIAGYGPHGAIVHYEATEETDLPLRPEGFLLLDTGGQYLEGTTDITRTIPLGPLSNEQKLRYTLVLKGNLNLANARFVSGTHGINLDAIARLPLWKYGLDYNHGTGHGVGSFLNVHEGPQNISRRMRKKPEKSGELQEGMVLSDEPGVYVTGQYGIRLENLMITVKDEKTDFGDFLSFRTLTLVPFAREAILPEYLTEEEKKWLNDYHKRVYEEIAPALSEKEQEELKEMTEEIL